jgi:hypothetical protein
MLGKLKQAEGCWAEAHTLLATHSTNPCSMEPRLAASRAPRR